jgi:uncharacterized RDD family membrane protein YckC
LGDPAISDRLLDTAQCLDTPEGVELQLPVAGLAPRALAWLIDAMIKGVTLLLTGFALGALGASGTAIYLLTFFMLLWIYNVVFEVLRHGATPGKAALGIRVVNSNGTPVGWTGSLIRNLIRSVDALPGTYLFGLLAVITGENFQRLGDLAAGTMVVYDPRKQAARDRISTDPKPVLAALSLDEQQALVSYGERVPEINKDRAEELAEIVRPLFGDIGADELCQHASWLAGQEPEA